MNDNNVTLDRIRRQMLKSVPTVPQINAAITAAKTTLIDVPLDVDELRAILMEELGVEHEVIQVVVVEKESTEIQFNDIYEFVPWYVKYRDSFSPEQVKALNTLEEAMGMIGKGCACRRSARERVATEYFHEFWSRNQKTDLLATIARIAAVPRVIIANVCSYPPSTP